MVRQWYWLANMLCINASLLTYDDIILYSAFKRRENIHDKNTNTITNKNTKTNTLLKWNCSVKRSACAGKWCSLAGNDCCLTPWIRANTPHTLFFFYTFFFKILYFFWLNFFHTFCTCFILFSSKCCIFSDLIFFTHFVRVLCLHFVFVILLISPFLILKQIRSDKMRRFKEFWVHVKCVQFCKEAENDELATLNLKCGYNAHVGAPTPTFLSRSIWAAWSPLLPISSHLSQKNEEHKTHAQNTN